MCVGFVSATGTSTGWYIGADIPFEYLFRHLFDQLVFPRRFLSPGCWLGFQGKVVNERA